MMSTEYEECIPSEENIKSMKDAGYKVMLDGKVYKSQRGRKKKDEKTSE